MAVSPQAPLSVRVNEHYAACTAKIEGPSSFRNRDIHTKLRQTRKLHTEVLQTFFRTKNSLDQDLGTYYRMLCKLDELTLDLLSCANTLPEEFGS